MRVIKPLTHKITIKDVNAIYNPNIQSVCADELRRLYEGKCFNSSLIISIKSVDSTSFRRVTSSLNASVNICVKATTDAVVYFPGEIIPDCKIVRIEENKIILESRYANIEVPVDNSTAQWYTGDFVPIIVLYARHLQFKEKVALIGAPLMKSKLNNFNLIPGICYHLLTSVEFANHVNNKPENTEIKTLDELLAEVEIAKKQLSELPKDAVEFFSKLLGWYDRDAKLDKLAEKKNILDNMHPGYYTRSENERFDSPLVEFSKEKPDLTTVESSVENMQILMINQYLHNLHSVKVLSEVYNTKDLRDGKKVIWDLASK